MVRNLPSGESVSTHKVIRPLLVCTQLPYWCSYPSHCLWRRLPTNHHAHTSLKSQPRHVYTAHHKQIHKIVGPLWGQYHTPQHAVCWTPDTPHVQLLTLAVPPLSQFSPHIRAKCSLLVHKTYSTVHPLSVCVCVDETIKKLALNHHFLLLTVTEKESYNKPDHPRQHNHIYTPHNSQQPNRPRQLPCQIRPQVDDITKVILFKVNRS